MTTLIQTALAATITAALMMVGPGTSAVASAPAAQLSVTLTANEKTIDSGDPITYTGQVNNLGAEDVAVRIALSAPSYVELAEAADAVVEGNTATWSPTIAAGEDVTFSVDATIGTIPKTERRLTSIVTVFLVDGTTPIVRTADARFITGVADTPGDSATTSPEVNQPTTSQVPWLPGIGVLLAALVIIAVTLLHRRRRAPALPVSSTPEVPGVEVVDE